MHEGLAHLSAGSQNQTRLGHHNAHDDRGGDVGGQTVDEYEEDSVAVVALVQLGVPAACSAADSAAKFVEELVNKISGHK